MDYVPLRSVDGINRSKADAGRKSVVSRPFQSPKTVIGKHKKRRIRYLKYSLVVLLLGVILGYVINSQLSNKTSASKYVVIGLGNSFVDSTNSLGINLFKEAAGSGTANTLVYSPGLSMGVSLLADLNPGRTETPSYTSNQANQVLGQYMANISPNTLVSKNSIWTNQSNLANSHLNSVAQKFYSTQVHQVSSLNGSIPQIDNWLTVQSGGLLPGIHSVTTGQSLLLVGLGAFTPQWYYDFSTAAAPGKFFLPNGSFRQLKYMNLNSTIGYYQDGSVQAAELPIGQNQNLSMDIFMPADIGSFISSLTLNNLNGIIDQMSPANVNIYLPPFAVESGSNFALMPGFSNIVKNAGYSFFGQAGIYQENYLKVDSNGYFQVPALSYGGATGNIMTVNSPFVFVVRDNTTGLILFMGAVFNP